MTIYGVDISHYNEITIKDVVNAGMDFCFISVGDGTVRDRKFTERVKEALDNKPLIIAAYYFVRASSEGSSIRTQAEVIAEQYRKADNCFWLPIFLDCETHAFLSPDEISELAFLLREKGIRVCGIYTGENWWGNYGWRPEYGSVLWTANYPFAPGTIETIKASPSDAYRIAGGDNSHRWGFDPDGPGPIFTNIWQYTDRGQINGADIDCNAFRGTHDELQALIYGSQQITRPDPGLNKNDHRILDYPKNQLVQDTYYNCGPATVQTIIAGRTGRIIPESEFAAEMGTTVNGTNHIGLVANCLSKYTGVQYTVSNLPDYPKDTEELEKNIRGSIDAGYGVGVNIVAPPSNYPKAIDGISPAYRGGTVYHYIAIMGYRYIGNRMQVWVVDSGFQPFEYWISVEQLRTLIPPKGYCFVSGQPKATEKEDDMTQFDQIQQRYRSRVPGSHVDMRPIDMLLNTDAHSYLILQEIRALRKEVQENNARLAALEEK